jgi:hypothetical protein
MIHNDRVYGKPLIPYSDTQANIEALTVAEGSVAYATDINKHGYYNGTSWVWDTSGRQYRQFVWVDDGAGSWEFVSAGGEPILNLQSLE